MLEIYHIDFCCQSVTITLMPKSPEISLEFSPIEQRYVASCYPLPDRPGIAACLDWRVTFTQYALQLQRTSVAITQLIEPFPHLAQLALKGQFTKSPIQAYFEGLEFPETANGIDCHNPNLYLFAGKIARHNQQNHVLAAVLDHVSGCSVKPVYLPDTTMTDFAGTRQVALNTQFLQLDSDPTKFALVHGFDQQNRHQVIRYITPIEYHRFKDWFLARQRSPHNPFQKK